MKHTHYTELENIDEKLDIIDHVNEEHGNELLTMAQAYGHSSAKFVQMIDIYQEGCLLALDKSLQNTLFIPFELEGDLEEKILYLAYSAMAKTGQTFGNQKKQYFTVIQSQKISKNMLRIQLTSHQSLPENESGFAWYFSLKKLSRLPEKIVQERQKLSKVAQLSQRLLLWWMKKASRQQRQKIIRSMNQGARYYTLRKVVSAQENGQSINVAWVDIFLHGDTKGSLWAESLQAGDIIHSTHEYHEKTDHLHSGETVLIGDETSLPTVIHLLENWQNPQAAHVIVITHQLADQDYLPDHQLPEKTKIHRIHQSKNVAQDVITYLKTLNTIDAAWGALENEDAKTIRHYLRNERQLNAQKNRIKAYWRRD